MLTLSIAFLCAASPTIHLIGEPVSAVEVRGISARLRDATLTVVVASESDDETAKRQPLLGSYSTREGILRFEPRFPFEPGVSYCVLLRVGNDLQRQTFSIPKPKTTPAEVKSLFPSAQSIPENTLRFYVQFTKPMARGNVYQHIRLRNDTDGKYVDLPFLELDEELWTPDQSRLTLLVDPGRIKREVKPREDLGPALEAGKKYTLSIVKGLKDANGNILEKTYQKSFMAEPADRSPIDPKKWEILEPSINTSDNLQVRFEKPLDHGMALRMIEVRQPDGTIIEGRTTISEFEKSWVFTPKSHIWKPGKYQLAINPRLEDVCGNRPGIPFEVDVRQTQKASAQERIFSREFVIGPK